LKREKPPENIINKQTPGKTPFTVKTEAISESLSQQKKQQKNARSQQNPTKNAPTLEVSLALRPRGHGDAERFSGRQPPVPSVSARCEADSRWH